MTAVEGLARRWLRRRLGPDPVMAAELSRQVTRAIRLVSERDQARAETAAVDAAARKHMAAMDRRLHEAYEPPVGACTKARLRDRAEAEQYARTVEHDTGAPAGAFNAYACTVCPRQPIGVGRYWHIGNADPRKRSSAEGHQQARQEDHDRRRRRQGRAQSGVFHRIGPEAASALRARVAGPHTTIGDQQ